MNKVKLVDICTPKQWKTIPTSELLNKGYPVYGANGIIGYYDKYNHENSVVAITCRGATCGSVHITVPNAYITGNAMCLDDLREDIEPYYLYYCLLHFDFQSVISGSAQPQITRQGLEKVLIPICSRERQVSIANRLKKTENIIAKRKEELAKLDILVKSRFIEMFGDPVTNPMGWHVKPLLDMGDCKNGMNFHKGESGVELHCLGVGDFQNLSVIANTTILPTVSLNEEPSKEYLLQNEDIVFVRSNGNKSLVGRCVAVYPNNTPTVFSGFCIRFRLADREHLTTTYLLHVLKHESMRQKMTGRGANIQNLNQQILSSLKIPLPPLNLQKQFAAFVEQVDKSKAVLHKLLKKQELLRAALMQEYFGY